MKKEPRITYLGEPWPPKKQPRNKVGQYHKRSVLPYVTMAGIAGFGAFLVMNSGVTVEYQAAPIAKAAVIASSTVSLPEKIEQLKQSLADEMSACEYPHFKQETAVPVWDDNKAGTLPAKDKLSYGAFQFKISTVQRFYKTLHGENLSNYEAIQKAMDEKEARALAIDAWINIKGSINEWSCANESMKAKVEIIRELEK